jgi:diguanylate cyclase (GGDEF)-like protein
MLTDSSSGRGLGPLPNVRPHVLRTYARLLRQILDEIDEAVLVLDPTGETVLSNQAFERLLGVNPRRRRGEHTLRELLRVLGADVDAATLVELLESHGRPSVTLELRDRRTLSCHVTPISLQAPADHRLLTFREVTREHRELRELRHRAFHDRLTGLPNRELLIDRLERALTRRLREGAAVGLIFVDLDGFKQVNDEHGHAMGDRVLVEVAARLMREIRQADTVGRLGGDEFVIVLDGLPDGERLEQICGRIQQSLARPFAIDGKLFEVGASIGAVLEWNHETDPAELLSRADAMMYAAKREGSEIHIEADFPRSPDDRRNPLVHLLRTAIEEDQLEFAYLPLVALSDGAVIGVEALLRCSEPELAVLSPEELVELAEVADLVGELNSWAVGQAARTARTLRDAIAWDMTVHLNLSQAQLSAPGLAQETLSATSDAGIQANCVAFEISESVIVASSRDLEDELAKLTALGCRLFADDVSGPAVAAELLSDLGFSAIKLDRTTIAAAVDDIEAKISAQGLVERAHALHLSAVAEGVADEQSLRIARELGCETAQGYGFYGFPRPLEELLKLIG